LDPGVRGAVELSRGVMPLYPAPTLDPITTSPDAKKPELIVMGLLAGSNAILTPLTYIPNTSLNVSPTKLGYSLLANAYWARIPFTPEDGTSNVKDNIAASKEMVPPLIASHNADPGLSKAPDCIAGSKTCSVTSPVEISTPLPLVPLTILLKNPVYVPN
jgi:hypothetical protein